MEGYSHAEAATAFEPTARYAELRSQCPLHREESHDPPYYVLTRFDDVLEVLKQPDLWGNRHGGGVFFQESGVLGTTDEPDHSRQRHVLRDAFVPTAIERLRPRILEIATEQLERFLAIEGHQADFVHDFAASFPALAIAELLGVDPESRHEFQHWSDHAVAALSGGDIDAYHLAKSKIEEHVAAGLALRDTQMVGHEPSTTLFGSVIADDVLSRLAVARATGVIDTREALHLGYQLLVAGHETTTSLLGLMLYRLLQGPHLMQQLRADHSLLPTAIEEALRFDSPVHGLFRTNAEPTEVLGEQMAECTKMQLVYASANRDPSRFSNPDEFIIGRDQRELGKHIAFGWGIHHCIGAPLARLETLLAFELLLSRTTTIELAGEPRRNDSFVLHGLTSLPIRWTLASAH